MPPEEDDKIKCPKYDNCESKVNSCLQKIDNSILLRDYQYDSDSFLQFVDTLKNEIESSFKVDEHEFKKSKRNFYVNPWITPGIVFS